MAGFRVRRLRVGRTHGASELAVRDADLAKQAALALVAADERVRVAVDDLGYAEAELGHDATTQLRETLVEVRTHLNDAFRLYRLNHDPMPGSTDEVRARNLRIVQLCEWADDELERQTTALADRAGRVRRAPEVAAAVRADLEHLRARIPNARDSIDRLAVRYAREALARVDGNPAEADRLIGFAEHSVAVAEVRHAAGHREQASVALEASTASVQRAASLLDAVETFEVEALRAESMLVALVEECRRDLAAVLEEPRSRRVADVVGELQAALTAIPQAGVNTDPFAHLSRLREARTTLAAAIAAARERATDLILLVDHVHHAIRDADRRLEVARDAIAAHQGGISAEALTRLAESEHARSDLGHFLGGSEAVITTTGRDHREQVIAMAGRVASLASESLRRARHDIEASRRSGRPLGSRGRAESLTDERSLVD
ncbi:hypothetical protein [Agromyces sp. CCNWLW203]|uniref:hypothetical protein n=1 Tax=Agromyces sp. CCNWLW203 TaxID=3112842 RepID=UPI002F965D75